MELSGVTCGHLEPSAIIWDHLEPSGAIWGHMEPSEAIWCHLKPSGAIWGHLEPSGAIAHLQLFTFKGERGRGRAQRGPKTTHSGRARIWILQAALPAFLGCSVLPRSFVHMPVLAIDFALALALVLALDVAVAHVSCLFLVSLLRLCSSICFFFHCAFRSIADQVYWFLGGPFTWRLASLCSVYTALGPQPYARASLAPFVRQRVPQKSILGAKKRRQSAQHVDFLKTSKVNLEW